MQTMNTTRKWLKALALLGALELAYAPSAFALKFANQFVEFELPYQWQCGLEGSEWVCQSLDMNKKRDAIIVLAAKLKGDQDTLDRYQDYLSKPKTANVPGGRAVTSQVRYSKMTDLQSHLWVDSLHLESEIPGFYTRYLATIEKDIAVLVTYSVNKTKFIDYQKQFEDMVRGLKVFRKAGALNAGQAANLFQNAGGALTGSGIFEQAPKTVPGGKTAGAKTDANAGGTGLIVLLLAGAVGFIIWKKKKQNG